MPLWRASLANPCRRSSNQALQQILQFANLVLFRKSLLGQIMDIDGQEAVVVVARHLGDDTAVLDLALADVDLKLVRAAAGVAQVDMADERVDLVEAPG